jgi:hypothetical protein
MMKRNEGNREEKWAGQTAPFFVCRKVKDRSLRQLLQVQMNPVGAAEGCDLLLFKKSKKALLGPFSRTRG